MVEIKVTLRLPSPLRAINSGALQCQVTASLLQHPKPTHPGALRFLPERLVMSFLPSSSSSSSGSSTTEPFKFRAIHILPPLDNVIREDDPEGVADQSDPPK